MRIVVAWGGKGWRGELWPSPEAPPWARLAAERMFSMGISPARINEVLIEMRNTRIDNTLIKLNIGGEMTEVRVVL